MLLFVLFFVHKYEKEPEPTAHLEIPSLSSKVDLNNNDYLEAATKNLEAASIYSGKSAAEKPVSWRKTKLTLCGICLAAYFR